MYNDLYHHGVKGQKWGVRRTPAQLGHPESSRTHNGESTKSKKPKRETRKARTQRAAEEVQQLSDKELREQLNRMRMEREYVQMKAGGPSKGEKFVKDVVTNPAKQVAAAITAYYVREGAKYVLKKALKSSIRL